MEFDPHTLHHIIERIKQQLNCPQCGKATAMRMHHLKVVGNDFLVFQTQCDSCGSHIVLHVSLTGAEAERTKKDIATEEEKGSTNVSTAFHLESQEIEALRESLKASGGSFTQIFGAP